MKNHNKLKEQLLLAFDKAVEIIGKTEVALAIIRSK